MHYPPHVKAVREVSRWAEHPHARGGVEGTQLRVAQTFGLGTEDNPVFPGMHEASALVTGATLAAARAAWSGSAQHGASITGGGYDRVQVVPRTWTHLLAEASGQPIDPAAQPPSPGVSMPRGEPA